MIRDNVGAVVDVLVPVYNAEATIDGALQSIRDQTLRDIRIIVVDDGSTDGTPAIIARIAAGDDRVEVITTPNRGIVDALNTALAASSASFIARHDADDIAFPERLTKQFEFLLAHPDCVAVGCNAFHIDGSGSRTGHTTKFKALVVGDPFHAPSIEPYLMHPFLLVRRRSVADAGGYRYVFHAEDTDLYWRLTQFGRLTNLPEVLGEYRLHDNSVSAKSILNGRIAAVSSQLAAVSERRRRNGAPEIEFPKSALQSYQAAQDLQPILDLASMGMSEDERGYLEVATAAKLLELSSYRPYRLTRTDLSTIRRSIEQHFAVMSTFNQRQIVFRYMLGRRLLRKPLESLRLLPWKVMPVALRDLGVFLFRKHLLRRVPDGA